MALCAFRRRERRQAAARGISCGSFINSFISQRHLCTPLRRIDVHIINKNAPVRALLIFYHAEIYFVWSSNGKSHVLDRASDKAIICLLLLYGKKYWAITVCVICLFRDVETGQMKPLPCLEGFLHLIGFSSRQNIKSLNSHDTPVDME